MRRVVIGTWMAGLLAVFPLGAADAQVRDPWTGEPDPEAKQPDAEPEPEAEPEAEPEVEPEARPTSALDVDYDEEAEETEEEAEEPEKPKPPPAPIVFPHLFVAPTGRLLPAAMIYSSTGVDTGGGVKSDFRVGLGDVAEFGLATTDMIRKVVNGQDPEQIQPYVLATFKMGVREDLLFTHQPAVAIGFRKSFEHPTSGRDTRVASLYFAASKDLGSKFSLHAGGVFWDASIDDGDNPEVLLHDKGVAKQLRPFGGIEVEPLDDALILVDMYWAPEFQFNDDGTDDIELLPTLAWGVRYKVTDAVLLESGVRVPDIKDVNLLDAQIFGQFTFVSRKLSNWLRDIR